MLMIEYLLLKKIKDYDSIRMILSFSENTEILFYIGFREAIKQKKYGTFIQGTWEQQYHALSKSFHQNGAALMYTIKKGGEIGEMIHIVKGNDRNQKLLYYFPNT